MVPLISCNHGCQVKDYVGYNNNYVFVVSVVRYNKHRVTQDIH
jgi:hypothetical protein